MATDWTCPICQARHRQPQARCRRCDADLLRLFVCRERARQLGAADPARARVLWRGTRPLS